MSELFLPCKDFVERVTLFSEGLLSTQERERFEEHVLVCPLCAKYVDQIVDTTLLLARLGGSDAGAGGDAEHLSTGIPDSTERTRALKFLAADRYAPFGRTRWPKVGGWISARSGSPGRGVHACLPEQAPFWLNEELWIVLLDGPVERTERAISAPRGSLLERVDAWNGETQAAFATWCAERAHAHAVDVLERLVPDEARELRGRSTDAALGADARGHANDTMLDLDVRKAWDYLATAVEYQEAPASVAFTAAVAAEHSEPGGARDERRRQADWLYDELGLSQWLPRRAGAEGAAQLDRTLLGGGSSRR